MASAAGVRIFRSDPIGPRPARPDRASIRTSALPFVAPKTLTDLLAVSSRLSLDEFLRTFDCHYLVASGLLSGSLREGRERSDTGVLELGERVSHSPSVPNPQAGAVFAVRKERRGAGPDAAKITVGRSRDEDICIPDSSVSHRHAHFEREGEVLFLVDDDSRNGTFVNLNRLKTGVGSPVHDEDVITFGRVSYQLFSPAALFISLQAFREGAL